jgi:hypothetical protein
MAASLLFNPAAFQSSAFLPPALPASPQVGGFRRPSTKPSRRPGRSVGSTPLHGVPATPAAAAANRSLAPAGCRSRGSLRSAEASPLGLPLLLAAALVLLATLLAPEQPQDQEAICQRQAGVEACRVW